VTTLPVIGPLIRALKFNNVRGRRVQAGGRELIGPDPGPDITRGCTAYPTTAAGTVLLEELHLEGTSAALVTVWANLYACSDGEPVDEDDAWCQWLAADSGVPIQPCR
jgi:hypothetical protein